MKDRLDRLTTALEEIRALLQGPHGGGEKDLSRQVYLPPAEAAEYLRLPSVNAVRMRVKSGVIQTWCYSRLGDPHGSSDAHWMKCSNLERKRTVRVVPTAGEAGHDEALFESQHARDTEEAAAAVFRLSSDGLLARRLPFGPPHDAVPRSPQCVGSVYRWANASAIPNCRVGGLIRFRRADIDRAVEPHGESNAAARRRKRGHARTDDTSGRGASGRRTRTSGCSPLKIVAVNMAQKGVAAARP